MSLSRTPAILNVTDRVKNAMPNDIANLGWRATATTGDITASIHLPMRSPHDARALALPGATPLVLSRMLVTSSAGGSTSPSDLSQFRPASASRSIGLQ